MMAVVFVLSALAMVGLAVAYPEPGDYTIEPEPPKQEKPTEHADDGLLGGIVSILHNTPRFSGDRDEPDAGRSARLRLIGKAILEAARTEGPSANFAPAELAASLAAVGQHETGWARYVGEGRCEDGPPGMRCDPGPDGKPQARGYWQLWRSSCSGLWALEDLHRKPFDYLDGQVYAGARCAAVRLVRERERCFGRNKKGIIAGMFGGYMGRCDAPAAGQRVKTYETFVAVLELGSWPQPRAGFRPLGKRAPAERRAAAALLKEPVGTWRELDVDGRQVAALVTFHWRELSAPNPPRGWHRGVSLYERAN